MKAGIIRAVLGVLDATERTEGDASMPIERLREALAAKLKEAQLEGDAPLMVLVDSQINIDCHIHYHVRSPSQKQKPPPRSVP